MKRIPLTQGKYALVDDEDYMLVSQYKWYAHKERNTWYACCDIYFTPKYKKCLRMHRLILGLGWFDKRQGDHVDHNGLNNRRFNLRICTHQQNLQNRKGVKGVYYHKKAWMAIIGINGKSVYLGRFKRKKDALATRKKAEQKFFKEFTYGSCA